jgi:proline iminopeptidase
MSDFATRAKAFGYRTWAASMRPIERRSPKTKDAIVRAITKVHVAWLRRSPAALEAMAAPTLMLTMPGRKTGTIRTYPLFYMPDGDRYVVVGSYGGDHRHPQWYLNLMAAGECDLETTAAKMRVKAELATGERRAELWPRLLEIWPGYEDYQRHAGEHRELPVVVLTPC